MRLVLQVYGLNKKSDENPLNEKPLNMYGFSKLLFDNFVRSHLSSFESLVCGLRYFNVFGANENHKQGMASVIYHFNNQLLSSEVIKKYSEALITLKMEVTLETLLRLVTR